MGCSADVSGKIGGSRKALESSGTVTYSGMAAGDHTTELIGVADNCSVQDSNPRIISVTTGATSQTTFDVVCFGPRKANSGESTARELR